MDEKRQRRDPLSWRGRVTSVLVGAAGGMGINVLSNDFGYQGFAVAIALTGLVAASSWIRTLPARAPLARYAIRGLLAASFIAAVVAIVTPGWAGHAVLLSAALTATAVLIPTTVESAMSLLVGVTVIGFGVAVIGGGVDVLVEGLTLRSPVSAWS